MQLDGIVDLHKHPLDDGEFRDRCRASLEADGCLELAGFIRPAAIQSICAEGNAKQDSAYYCVQQHNVYLTPADDESPPGHVRNRLVCSSKGCITDDQIAADSALRTLYNSARFREFLCAVLEENALHVYGDTLSSINIHYAGNGQELGWHFDNSSFAITLMIRAPEQGGTFEYIRGMRDASAGDMNFAGVERVLNGEQAGTGIDLAAGTLLLFRGRDAIHRVTPVSGSVTRLLAVLAYNAEPGVALSESARMTFYGRLA
jgi:hypothetical protein